MYNESIYNNYFMDVQGVKLIVTHSWLAALTRFRELAHVRRLVSASKGVRRFGEEPFRHCSVPFLKVSHYYLSSSYNPSIGRKTFRATFLMTLLCLVDGQHVPIVSSLYCCAVIACYSDSEILGPQL